MSVQNYIGGLDHYGYYTHLNIVKEPHLKKFTIGPPLMKVNQMVLNCRSTTSKLLLTACIVYISYNLFWWGEYASL